MADTVYLAGAGFNCSIYQEQFPTRPVNVPPLALNFFKVMLQNNWCRERIEKWRLLAVKPPKELWQRPDIVIDALFRVIQRYWQLTIEDLKHANFDIEECLTLIQSVSNDSDTPPNTLQVLTDARIGLLNLLCWYLSELSEASLEASSLGALFGKDVWTSHSDVITFNYDLVAEKLIASASGVNATTKRTLSNYPSDSKLDELVANTEGIPDDDLDVSFFNWNKNLAYGTQFDVVQLPITGLGLRINGRRYYSANPGNALYPDRRILKLHGSINWLRYGELPLNGRQFAQDHSDNNINLEAHPVFHPYMMPGWIPQDHRGTTITPVIIPPLLIKEFDKRPFKEIWRTALESLSCCQRLIVVGYSFPPTDFRTKRLFLEAFADHDLVSLVIVNPDVKKIDTGEQSSVVEMARHLTHFRGEIEMYPDLRAFYCFED
jgi:hypothetical protein